MIPWLPGKVKLFGFSRYKKPAPGIPRTVLQEPMSVYQKSADRAAEVLIFRFCAGDNCGEGGGKVQAEHFHKAFSIGLILVVSYPNGERKGRCQRNKFLDIPNGSKLNFKFPHKTLLRKLYKIHIILYNGEQQSKRRLRYSRIRCRYPYYSIIQQKCNCRFGRF